MRLFSRRTIALAALVVVGAVVILIRPRPAASSRDVRLTWVATAHQFGPVGYRDPAGAISPDGHWLAYSEGRFLRVQPTDGGPLVNFLPGDVQIRALTWRPDSRTVVANGFKPGVPWATYDRVTRTAEPLWTGRDRITARDGTATRVADLRQLAWSDDGQSVAGVASGRAGTDLWVISNDAAFATVQHFPFAISWPAWIRRRGLGTSAAGNTAADVSCITTVDGRSRVTIPCGGAAVKTDADLDVYGPIVFAPDGLTLYAAFANEAGTLDLWRIPSSGGRGTRLTSFARDTYAPSIANDGSVLFKVQNYRTTVAVVPASGGAAEPVAMFQSETPSWDPTGRWLGITYGTWRRVVDDAHYPDIAQETGIIAADPAQPASRVARIVQASKSEDQSLCWSPNQKWIAFHSHKDGSDDVWLRPADSEQPARRLSFLGRGAETGWPRWSRDGKWILFEGADQTTHRAALRVIGIDQDTGVTTAAERIIHVGALEAELSHAEWLPDGQSIVGIAKEGPGRHVIYIVPASGGAAKVVARVESEHDNAGLALSPDGKDIAFVAPASDGYFQLFRQPLVAGGDRVQITTDPSHKTQPSWSPDGRTLAFTVWSYEAQMWKLRIE